VELTIDEALHKGIEAHKAGQIQEADRLYTAIIQVQPKHPHANHNMGVLAVGVGKVEEALPFFSVALEANPSVAQFWLSHIDTLINLGAIDDAKTMFTQAKEKVIEGKAFDQLEQRTNQLIKSEGRTGSDNNAPTQSENNILETISLTQALGLAKKNQKKDLPKTHDEYIKMSSTNFQRTREQ
jgi:thioredoxin-like negative regulator of GroEL